MKQKGKKSQNQKLKKKKNKKQKTKKQYESYLKIEINFLTAKVYMETLVAHGGIDISAIPSNINTTLFMEGRRIGSS